MKDFDFIKDKIENENITAPNSLNEDNVKYMLDSGAKPNIKVRKNKPFKSVVALVACLAVFVVSVVSVNALNGRGKVANKQPSDSALITYNSYDDLQKQIKDLEKERLFIEEGFGFMMKGDADTDSLETSAQPSHSETNIQVDGVDEADIIKTDGEYIYHINRDNKAVKILKVDGEKVEKVGFANLTNKGSIYAQELYLKDNKLIVISSYDYDYVDDGEYSFYYSSLLNSVIVSVFNIEDKSNPTLEYEYEQNGAYVSTRMINNVVYVVTNYYANSDNYIPKVNGKEIPCDCIYGVPEVEEPRFVVVGAFDINKNDSSKVKSKAILGGAWDIYCSTDNLYVQSVKCDWDKKYENCKTHSNIIKLSLDNTKLDIVATAQIDGEINNQYSMNEKDGYFFVAATTQTENYKDINTLYVLDEKLNSVSKVDNFAKNESIKAVRYIGNYAYVITYEQTDPLFVIDLSDVHNPQIKGSVKIDGFSTSLMPVDENTLLGVGNNVTDLAQDGIKLVLFDISNPEQPKVKSELSYPDYYSDAQYNIKAITMFDNKVAIPLNYCVEDDGILLLEIEDDSINEVNRFCKDMSFNRVVQIGDYLYGLVIYGSEIEAIKM